MFIARANMHFLHALVVVVATLGNNVDAIAERGLEAKPQRILRAATKRSDLYRRSVRITKRFETEMAYVESRLLTQVYAYPG